MKKALFTGLLTLLCLPGAVAQTHGGSRLPLTRKSAPERHAPKYVAAPGRNNAESAALSFNAACMFQSGWSTDFAEFGDRKSVV